MIRKICNFIMLCVLSIINANGDLFSRRLETNGPKEFLVIEDLISVKINRSRNEEIDLLNPWPNCQPSLTLKLTKGVNLALNFDARYGEEVVSMLLKKLPEYKGYLQHYKDKYGTNFVEALEYFLSNPIHPVSDIYGFEIEGSIIKLVGRIQDDIYQKSLVSPLSSIEILLASSDF